LTKDKYSVKRPKFPPYCKPLIARRIAHDRPGLVVISAGGWTVSQDWQDNPRISRLAVPLDADPVDYAWYPLDSLDTLIIPDPAAPVAWLERLILAVWAGEPRMIWLQDGDDAIRLCRGLTYPFSVLDRVPLHDLGRAIRDEVRGFVAVNNLLSGLGHAGWDSQAWFS
jgi:hypothetical protein